MKVRMTMKVTANTDQKIAGVERERARREIELFAIDQSIDRSIDRSID